MFQSLLQKKIQVYSIKYSVCFTSLIKNQDLGWVPTLRHPRSHHPACGGTAACAICKPSLPGRSQTPGTQQWLARKTILITWMMMPSSTSWNLFEEELWNAFPAYTCSRGGRNSRLDTAGNHSCLKQQPFTPENRRRMAHY